jgi:Gpi18-like mannosyltransferase
MVANSAVWGQCDSIYLSFELAAVYYIMKKAPVRAVVSVGLAFAFKIQTVFMGPFLLALLLRKRFSWWHLPLVVGVWLATILPIVLLGRSFSSVMDIYTKQVSGEYGIAEGIANPWSWFYHLHLPESLGINVALLLTVATAAFLTYLAYRRQRLDPAWLFFFASTCLVVFPYVMPKMHDRYFSSGVVFLVILACYDLRFLLPAALFECALLLPTVRFLTNEAHRFNHFTTANIDVAIWSSTAGIFLILRQLWRTRQAPSESAALDTSGIEQAPPIDAPA